jgi:2-phospho-L-lactate/phosphoenolpyruvate guanylyltransferase
VIAALVPVRGFETGKSRLAEALGQEPRRLLIQEMAETALQAVSGLDVRVVTPDREVTEWARDRGAAVMTDSGPDLNATLERARYLALSGGASSVLVLFADLPSVTPDDVHALLPLRSASDTVLAPDHAGTGTNAVHVGPSSPLRYRFGPGSLAAHLALAPSALVVRRPGLGQDLDDPLSPVFSAAARHGGGRPDPRPAPASPPRSRREEP